jgi:hypothetical protein
MSELTLLNTSFYHYQGMYYLVRGDLLVQFDHNYYLEFPKENEVYGFYMRRFKKMEPANESEARRIFNRLIRKLNEITN